MTLFCLFIEVFIPELSIIWAEFLLGLRGAWVIEVQMKPIQIKPDRIII